MSDNPTATPATDPADNGGATGGTPSTAPPAAGQAPKWTGEFDPERAAKLVENLRQERDEVRAKLQAREDAEKSEAQKLSERLEAAERRAAELERQTLVSTAAREHNLPADLVEFVTGSTEAEIKASAEKVATRFGVHAAPADDDALPGRPKPRLTPGHGTPDSSPDFDPVATARAARGY